MYIWDDDNCCSLGHLQSEWGHRITKKNILNALEEAASGIQYVMCRLSSTKKAQIKTLEESGFTIIAKWEGNDHKEITLLGKNLPRKHDEDIHMEDMW